MPRAVPKALKSKTFATQEELRQRDCRLCSRKALHSSHSLVASGPTGLGSSVAAAPFERLAEEGAGKANSPECDPTPPGPAAARDCRRACERAELGSAPPSEPTSWPLRGQRFSGLGRKRYAASKPGKLRVLRAVQGGGADGPRCFW